MTKYSSGAKIEREIRKELEGDGYYVIRSAGSKGCFDLIAVNSHEVRFIQVKYGKRKGRFKLNKSELKRLKAVKIPKNCTKEAWFREKGIKEYEMQKM